MGEHLIVHKFRIKTINRSIGEHLIVHKFRIRLLIDLLGNTLTAILPINDLKP